MVLGQGWYLIYLQFFIHFKKKFIFFKRTENTPMIIGLGKAAELVIKNLEKYYLNMKDTRDYLESRLIV